MNTHCHKVIFSKRLGTLVAVGEHTASTGKAASGQGCRGSVVAHGFVGALRFTCASVALACLSLGNTQAQSSQIALLANALPQGGSVSTGSATISTSGANMAITQSTDKASINWQSFNIGTGASVNIAQPSSSAVLLNRVVGNDPSQILGQLKANGQVILLNPNGVLFGKDGSVTASAFTASTFGLSDADFMAGYYKYNRNGSTAAVVNQGTIETSAGGFVALIGATVTNEGTIRAPQGDMVMAAAESVTLPEELVKPQPVNNPNTVSVRMSKRVRLELDPAAINTAVNNTESGVIVTEGGQVLLQAAALSSAVASVTHSGRIDTSAPQAGTVTVLADNGVIKVDGSIKANSSGTDNQGQVRKGGDIIIGRDLDTGELAKTVNVSGATLESQGGFVETSGKYLAAKGTTVKAKDWLLDPYNIIIAGSGASGTAYADGDAGMPGIQYTPGSASTILASDIAANLNAGTSVKLSTGLTGSAGTDAGNITIAQDVTITKTGGGDATLTLEANNGIDFKPNAKITNTSNNKLNVVLTANGDANAAADSYGIRFNGSSGVDTGGKGDVTVVGTSKAATGNGMNAGFYIYNGATLNAENVDITATYVSPSGATGTGISFFATHDTSLIATGNLTLRGTATGTTAGYGIYTGENTGGAIVWRGNVVNIQGTLNNASLTSLASGSAQLNSVGATALSAVEITGTSSVTIKGTTNDSRTNAVSMLKRYAGLGAIPKVQSSGDVLIQANQGSINLQNLQTDSIKGSNITIDNTNSNLVADGSGNISKGSGTYNGSINAGVRVAANTSATAAGAIQATEKLTIVADAQNAISLSSTAGMEAKQFQVNADSTNSTAIHLNTGAGFKTLTGGTASLIKGTATGTNGGQAVLINGTVSLDATNAGITLEGNANTIAGGSFANKRGLRVDGATTTMYGNVTLKGSSGSSDGILFINSANNTIKNGGTLTIEGVNTSTSGDTNGVQLNNSGGIKGEANSTILVKGTLNNNITGSGALVYGSGIDSAGRVEIVGNRLSNNSSAVNIGALVRSSASDVVIRSLGGSIATSGNIQGGNITIDNTNGVIDSLSGAVTSKGTAIAANNGVTLGGSVTARNNLNVYGSSTQAGVVVASGQLKGNNVTITGEGQNERGVLSYTSVTSPSVVTPLIEATGGNLLIKGTANNASQTAISLEGNGTVKASGNIELQGDRQTLAQTINAGSGTGNVTLRTTTDSRAINIGSEDSSSALGISQTELNFITAGKTIIGNSSAGKISAETGITTKTATGDLTLQTGGDIEFKAALNVGVDVSGNTPSKKLTLNAGGNVTQTTATSAIKAAELQLVGGNGTHMLNNQSNTIGKISGSAKKITFNNIGELKVGSATETLNAEDGITLLTGGNLDIQNTIANTNRGEVILAAGYGHAAESGLDNNILTKADANVSNGSDRSIRLYTGSTAATGKLANLHNSLSTLDLEAGVTGTDSKQNTMTGTSFLQARSIDNGANVQAFFREKVAFNTTFTTPALVEKTYGVIGTKDEGTQLADTVKSALKVANTGNATVTTTNNNVFQIKKSTLIDNMTFDGGMALSNASFSTSRHLKASDTTYKSSKMTTSNSAYTLGDVAAETVKVKVNKADLTIGGLIATDKEYDGNAIAQVNANNMTKTGLSEGDVLTRKTTSTGSFRNADNTSNDKNVARAIDGTVQVKTVALTNEYEGADLGNYNLIDQTTTTAKITPKALFVSGITAKNKVYDGNADAVTDTANVSKTGIIGSDEITVSSIGKFRNATNTAYDKNVALSNSGFETAKTVALTNTYTGADVGNYTISDQLTTTATITQKPLAANYLAKDKVFDGSTTADVTGTVAPISGDKVNVLHTSANFDSPDIGTAKTVTVSGISLSGADAANYKVDSTVNAGNKATTKASITAVPPKPPVPVVPTDGNSSRVKVPVGSANPFALASAEDLADDTCSANSIENCHCEASPLNANVDICYEPKDGAKGSAR